MSDAVPPDEAGARQARAADPARSTWVSANAGSGKTRVLIDRVARMMLDGVDPQRILCLTYTKAAATEMQNRLFRRLGEWAMQPDADLASGLAGLGIPGAITGARLARARRLFAQAIETPGGLRILTIHALCAALLRRFPLEAGVSPTFTEMDDRAALMLRADIVEAMADGLAPDVVAAVAAHYTGEDFAHLTAEIGRRRGDFAPPLDAAGCRALFGVAEGETPGSIAADVLSGNVAGLLAGVIPVLERGSVTDRKSAQVLAAFDMAAPDLAALEHLFLYGAKAQAPFGAKIGKVPTKATAAALGPLLPPLEALMRRVEAARPRRVTLAAAEKAAALHGFAAVFLPEYAARKAARGLLDFDDLIFRARDLLTDPSLAQWVLFRLDGGIDHILVDEAQDTSPVQWQVIAALAAEFTAGEGARGQARTLFVVGDPKQSIYSFQGADLAVFAAKRADFTARFAGADAPMQEVALEHSFRSAPAILRLVDATFADTGHGMGRVNHIAWHDRLPGRAEVWPVFEKAAEVEPEHWWDPVDVPGAAHHATRLGRAIAARIKAMLDAGTQVPTTKGIRALRAGDILILVRRRSEIFDAVIGACKAAGLPVAGSDRMKLGAELAVRDITAVLAFLALPEDDLSLAAALRSPLFGLTEGQLYALAQGRAGTLWQALRTTDLAPGARDILDDLRGQADFLRPYDLIERLLTRHDGRRRLIARLGDEAADGIDAMLAQALAHERQEVPGLTGFLVWLDADKIEVKRQPDGAGDRIRVMTVHGAKGLEAPLVILPDIALYRQRERDEVMAVAGVPVWKTPAESSPEAIAAARADRRARDTAESLRLLYVAMTRAETWLIAAAAGDLGKEQPEDEEALPAWYHLIRGGMIRAGAVPSPEGGLLLADPAWPAPLRPGEAARAEPVPTLPGWAWRPAPDAPLPVPPLSPSALGGAKALPGDAGEDSDAAQARGTRLHRLLEVLPGLDPASWPALAPLILEGSGDADDLLAEAAEVLSNPALAAIFAPDTLAEVAVAGDWRGQAVSGAIDRLIVTPTRVCAIDFKSNRTVPDRPGDVPEGILRQLGAYAHVLRQIFPDRPVEVAILWTRTATLMPIPDAAVIAALQATPVP